MLVLGGSGEASALVASLSQDPAYAVILSLAGRTVAPLASPVAVRVGGFGGAVGLQAYLCANAIDVLVDATHPFAMQISENARIAAAASGCPLLRVTRPPWRAGPSDIWLSVGDAHAAAIALGPAPRRVFLTVGRLQLAAFAAAPQHDYLVRTIDPQAADHGLRQASFVTGRGPFAVADEERLLRSSGIDALVTKNSGGAMSAAKLEAARRLGITVVMIERPGTDEGLDVPAALAELRRHASAQRGV